MKITQNRKSKSVIILPHALERTWENALFTFLHNRKNSKAPTLKSIVHTNIDSVKTLWESFTRERSQLPKYLMDPKQMAYAYLLGFHLPNCSRTYSMLYRVMGQLHLQTIAEKSPCHIIDFGTGTGALASSILAMMGPRAEELQVSLWDFRTPFLQISEQMAASIAPKANIKTYKRRLEEFSFSKQEHSSDGVNILTLGFVWNEIVNHPAAAKRFLAEIIKYSQLQTAIILVDSANQGQSRSLMELREHLCDNNFHVIYPCPSSHTCPMLELRRDWCFSEDLWKRHPIVEKIDRSLYINREKINYTGMIFLSESLAKDIDSTDRKGEIVVGRPLVQGKPKYLLCSNGDLSKQPILEKNPRLRGLKIQEN